MSHDPTYDRAPTLGERFGLSPALRGNAALVPEEGWAVDAGARWSPRANGAVARAYLEGFAFARFASQLIAWLQTRDELAVCAGLARPAIVVSKRSDERWILTGLENLLGLLLMSLRPGRTSGARSMIRCWRAQKGLVLRDDGLPGRRPRDTPVTPV